MNKAKKSDHTSAAAAVNIAQYGGKKHQTQNVQ